MAPVLLHTCEEKPQWHESHGPLFLCCTHTARLQSTLSSGLRQRNHTEVASPRAGVNTPSIFLLLQEKLFLKRDLFSLTCHSSWTRPFQFCLQSSRGTLETLKLSRIYDSSLRDTIFSISQSTLKYHEMNENAKPKLLIKYSLETSYCIWNQHKRKIRLILKMMNVAVRAQVSFCLVPQTPQHEASASTFPFSQRIPWSRKAFLDMSFNS